MSKRKWDRRRLNKRTKRAMNKLASTIISSTKAMVAWGESVENLGNIAKEIPVVLDIKVP